MSILSNPDAFVKGENYPMQDEPEERAVSNAG
jgi:hypothetical protein